MSVKKRKVTDECRVFQEAWSERYFFIEYNGKATCLICKETVGVMKEYNVKRHYDTKHAGKYKEWTGQLRKDKVKEFQRKLTSQQNIFRKVTDDSEIAVKASFVVSKILVKKMKPYKDGELVKECLEEVANIAFPEKKSIISKISLNRMTVSRRAEEMASDIEKTLKEKILEFKFFSLAMDESTDVTDTSQLSIFIRGINEDFHITEELLALVPMKDTTNGSDIYCEVKNILEKYNLDLKLLYGISTDGAPAMVGNKRGVVNYLATDCKNMGNDIVAFHCILHQGNLCARTIHMEHVMKAVIKVINFLRSRGLTHRQFREFLLQLDTQYGDVLYFTQVRWLSAGKMLKRVYDLRKEIIIFLKSRDENLVADFENNEWVCDLSFLVDITQHLNELNTKLQGKNNMIHNLFYLIKSFEVKLILWQSQLTSGLLTHFSTMNSFAASSEQPINFTKYASLIENLQNEFKRRFQDMRKFEKLFDMFALPFTTDVEIVPIDFQMELIDLQSNSELKTKFSEVSLLDFYKNYLPEEMKALNNHALKTATLFGSTYLCEQSFSLMKQIKSRGRSRLTDEHLEGNLRIAVSNIEPDIDRLVKNRQCQVSH